MVDFGKLAEQYKKELLDNVLPFWLEKSQDRVHGDYYTCLDRTGNVFDRDKFVRLQGREMERVLSCAARIVSMLANLGKIEMTV